MALFRILVAAVVITQMKSISAVGETDRDIAVVLLGDRNLPMPLLVYNSVGAGNGTENDAAWTIPTVSFSIPNSPNRGLDVIWMHHRLVSGDSSDASRADTDAILTFQMLGYIKQRNYSSIVFVPCHTFTDNAFHDDKSSFVKLLRVINYQMSSIISLPTSAEIVLYLYNLPLESSSVVQQFPVAKITHFAKTAQVYAPNLNVTTKRIILSNSSVSNVASILSKLSETLKSDNGDARNVLMEVGNQLSSGVALGSHTLHPSLPSVTSTSAKVKINEAYLIYRCIQEGIWRSEVATAIINYVIQHKEISFVESRRNDIVNLITTLFLKGLKSHVDITKEPAALLKQMKEIIQHDKSGDLLWFEILKDSLQLTNPVKPRNPHDVSIVVIGKGGSGISSTVDRLMGHNAEILRARKTSAHSLENVFVKSYTPWDLDLGF